MAIERDENGFFVINEEMKQTIIEEVEKRSDEERKQVFTKLGQWRQDRANRGELPDPLFDEMYKVFEKYQP